MPRKNFWFGGIDIRVYSHYISDALGIKDLRVAKTLPTGRVIRVVVEPDEQRALVQAATRASLPLATWVRVVALERARQSNANPVGK